MKQDGRYGRLNVRKRHKEQTVSSLTSACCLVCVRVKSNCPGVNLKLCSCRHSSLRQVKNGNFIGWFLRDKWVLPNRADAGS